MRKTILLLAAIINISFGYRQHVHQYISIEAYKLLKLYIGGEVPIMNSRIGGSEPWFIGEQPWQRGYVTTGAWREDVEDMVFGYSNTKTPPGVDFQWLTTIIKLMNENNEYYSSVTHFWYADDGDAAQTHMRAGAHTISPNIPPIIMNYFSIENAYQKMLKYAYGGYMLYFAPVPWMRVKKPVTNGYEWLRLIPGTPNSVALSYSSIIDLYNNNRMYTQLIGGYKMWNETKNRYEWYSGPIIIDDELKDLLVWEILGRMCHLLQDMSVPAHANIDPHGNDDALINDYYESAFGYEYYWNAENTFSQIGGILNPFNNQKNPMHFLMYITSQMANHFSTQGPHKRQNNDYSGGEPSPEELAFLNSVNISQFGDPTSEEGPWSGEAILNVRDKMLPHAIRATASLLYWFAIGTNMLPNTAIQNNFQSGTIVINDANRPSPYHFQVCGTVQPATIEAVDQYYQNCFYRFQHWEKIVNGSVVQTLPSRRIIITPEANTTYKAIFANIYQYQVSISGPTGDLFWGESAAFTMTPISDPPATSYSVQPYRRNIYNGQSVWNLGMPECNGISFFYPQGGNTAIFTNSSFDRFCPAWGDSVLKIESSAFGCCGVVNFTNFLTFRSTPRPYIQPPPPPPNGCPYVYSFNGSQLIADNNILPQSEQPGNEGIDVIDYYQLFNSPVETGGMYKLAVAEFEHERSFLDQFELWAVDHSPETRITVDDSGTVFQFSNPFCMIDAQLDSESVMKQISEMDNVQVRVTENDTLDLWFSNNGSTYERGLLVVGHSSGTVKNKIAGTVKSSRYGKSPVFTSFRLRRLSSYTWLIIPAPGKSDDPIPIVWNDEGEVDYTALSESRNDTMSVQKLEVAYARHSTEGDVTDLVRYGDASYSIVNQGDWIEFGFPVPPMQEGSQRSFIFVSKGRYEHLGKGGNISGVLDETRGGAGKYLLYQNYPNPFNPMTKVKYHMRESAKVTIKIYDVLDHEISRLVDEVKQPGLYEAEFNGSNLPTGTYFYELRAGDYSEAKKMIILK